MGLLVMPQDDLFQLFILLFDRRPDPGLHALELLLDVCCVLFLQPLQLLLWVCSSCSRLHHHFSKELDRTV
jgi:hypothetical protein